MSLTVLERIETVEKGLKQLDEIIAAIDNLIKNHQHNLEGLKLRRIELQEKLTNLRTLALPSTSNEVQQRTKQTN